MKNIRKIGAVKLEEVTFGENPTELYIPIRETSGIIGYKYKEVEESFTKEFGKEYPQLRLEDCKLLRDISLCMSFDGFTKQIAYTISIILWAEDEKGREIKTKMYEPLKLDMNGKDAKALKDLVFSKLGEFYSKKS